MVAIHKEILRLFSCVCSLRPWTPLSIHKISDTCRGTISQAVSAIKITAYASKSWSSLYQQHLRVWAFLARGLREPRAFPSFTWLPCLARNTVIYLWDTICMIHLRSLGGSSFSPTSPASWHSSELFATAAGDVVGPSFHPP